MARTNTPAWWLIITTHAGTNTLYKVKGTNAGNAVQNFRLWWTYKVASSNTIPTILHIYRLEPYKADVYECR